MCWKLMPKQAFLCFIDGKIYQKAGQKTGVYLAVCLFKQRLLLFKTVDLHLKIKENSLFCIKNGQKIKKVYLQKASDKISR